MKRSEVPGFTTVIMNVLVFWVVALCILVEYYGRFGDALRPSRQGDGLMIDAANISETSAYLYTAHSVSEVSQLHK
jgi:hypothetical protein